MHKLLWDFEINGLPNLGQTTKSSNNQQKKRTCKIVDFAILSDHKVKLKENEKREKHQDLTRELKKTIEHESNGDTNCN